MGYQTVSFSMFFVMVATFLPAFARFEEKLEKLAHFSFIGANTDYMSKLGAYSLTSPSFLAQVIWLVALLAISIWAYRRTIIVGN